MVRICDVTQDISERKHKSENNVNDLGHAQFTESMIHAKGELEFPESYIKEIITLEFFHHHYSEEIMVELNEYMERTVNEINCKIQQEKLGEV